MLQYQEARRARWCSRGGHPQSHHRCGFALIVWTNGRCGGAGALWGHVTGVQRTRTRGCHLRTEVAIMLLGDLSRRLRRDARLLQDAAFLDVPARLARTLLRLAEAGADGVARTPRLTQTDLAGIAGLTSSDGTRLRCPRHGFSRRRSDRGGADSGVCGADAARALGGAVGA